MANTYYDALIAKWATAPPGTTQSKLTWINSQTANGPPIAMIIPTYKVYNLIVRTEFNALDATGQQSVRDIIGMGTVDASPNTEVRKRVVALFPNGTGTFTALSGLAATYDTPQIPWWQANGYARPFDLGDIAAAGLS